MSKFDKKVLKYVAAHQEDDLDVDDIAIGLRLDEDDVLEALDSLKAQGKVEGSPRNGKTFWRLSMPESEPVEETEQVSPHNEPDVVAIDLDQAIAEQSFKSKHAPVSQKMEPDEIEKNPEPSADMILPPKQSVSDAVEADDDTDLDLPLPPNLGDSPVVRIAIAVVLSVVISALVSMMIAGGSQKGFSDGIQALERKSTETNANLEKRIAEISAQMSVLSDKLSGRQQQPRTEQNRAAAVKPSHASHKKRAASKHASADVSPASSSEPSPSPASDQSTPSSSSGPSDNPAPAPESTSPSPTEGTGGSGQ